MQVSGEVAQMIEAAFLMARNAHFEYVTPELMLYIVCQNEEFAQAFENCGGRIQKLDQDLKTYLEEYLEPQPEKEIDAPQLSQSAANLLSSAWASAQNSDRNVVELPHIIHAMYELPESYAVYYMRVQGIGQAELLQEMLIACEENESEVESANGSPSLTNKMQRRRTKIQDDDRAEERDSHTDAQKGFWQKYAVCLNDALEGENPLIGRQEELERTMQILCRKEKNHPLYIGEPGVGKTAIVYGFARLLNQEQVPGPLMGAKIFSLDLGSLLAGTQYRGDFEKRLKKVMDSISKEKKPIIYIDEIHNIVGAGAVNGSSLDISNMLKPYFSKGHIRFMGATTFEEYKKYFEKNKSLVRRFQNVEIKEPEVKDAVQILEGLQEIYEQYHQVRYEDGVIEYAVLLSAKYMNERYLPDKAIDLIDEAGAYCRMQLDRIEDTGQDRQDKKENTGQDRQDKKENTGQDRQDKKEDTGQDGQDKKEDTGQDGQDKKEDTGQDGQEDIRQDRQAGWVTKAAIDEIVAKICHIPKQAVESEETQKLATLAARLQALIFGQDEAITQVVNAVKLSRAGLLEAHKPLASLLFVGPTGVGKTEIAKNLAKELGIRLIRFDMSEYEEKHAVAKFIGAPAGYVGYEEGGLLTEEVRKHPHAVLLLDEIEKAHPDIYNILLQVMDYATLTDNQGRKADFRNVIIIMTSNAGANRIGKPGIGFLGGNVNTDVVMEEVKRIFQPEFRNRLTKIVVFQGMSKTMAEQVVEKKLGELKELLLQKNIQLQADAAAKKLIQSKGISNEYGAREIERVIQSEIKPLFVDEILFGQLKQGGSATLTGNGDGFQIIVDDVSQEIGFMG